MLNRSKKLGQTRRWALLYFLTGLSEKGVGHDFNPTTNPNDKPRTEIVSISKVRASIRSGFSAIAVMSIDYDFLWSVHDNRISQSSICVQYVWSCSQHLCAVQKSLRQSLAIAKVFLFHTVNSAKGADVGHKMGFKTSSTVNGSPYTLTRVWTFLFLLFIWLD